MLALAFENLSSMGNDDELVKKNVEVIRNEQEDASGDESKSCDKETKSAHTKFQGAQFKFKSFLRPEVLKRFRMIRLKVGNFKSIYGDIKHTDQDADGINVHFDPLPDSPPINPRISHDVMFLPNQLNLCLGYEALQLIEKFGLTDFFRDFEEEPSGSLRSLSPSFQSPSSPCYNLESPLSSSSESHESTECKAVVQSPSKLIDHFDWINTSIDSNLEQQRAVKNIVNCTAYPFPFVIFGPPGTESLIWFLVIRRTIFYRNWKDNCSHWSRGSNHSTETRLKSSHHCSIKLCMQRNRSPSDELSWCLANLKILLAITFQVWSRRAQDSARASTYLKLPEWLHRNQNLKTKASSVQRCHHDACFKRSSEGGHGAHWLHLHRRVCISNGTRSMHSDR